MPIKLEATPVFAGYRPPCEDEEGLTPRQRQERRNSLNRATMLVYDSTMTTEVAKRMMQMPIIDIASELDIEWERARDVRELARRHLERINLLEEAHANGNKAAR